MKIKIGDKISSIKSLWVETVTGFQTNKGFQTATPEASEKYAIWCGGHLIETHEVRQ